jgi:hypothetical protein
MQRKEFFSFILKCQHVPKVKTQEIGMIIISTNSTKACGDEEFALFSGLMMVSLPNHLPKSSEGFMQPHNKPP